ncbi:hypothetical protein [Agrococcus sp. TSP3-2-1]|uniref:hypothetical protein n=1 Tax=Agrococcus sp. TSP3-2-1 TaxID=2804583 RepID=UPI003CE7087D
MTLRAADVPPPGTRAPDAIAAIPAVSIVSPAGRRSPAAAAAALGAGLRAMHAIDAASCPFPAPD